MGQLNKYPMNPGEKIPWVYEKEAATKGKLPFFSWYITNPHERVTFKHVNEAYLKHVQVKAHAADPLEVEDRIEWLQNVLGSMQPLTDLAQVGISVVDVSDPVPMDEDWTIEVENQSAVDITLMVNPGYHDGTQSGEIAAIEPNFEIKKEES